MNLTPWKTRSLTSPTRPFMGDEIANLQREMNSLVNTFFGNRDSAAPSNFNTTWYPSVDLREKDNKYLLDADVPGMSEADLDIDFHDNILTLKGETKSEKETTESGYVCVERSRGSFRRDIYLDEEVDKDSIKADLKNGVLHIEMVKKEAPRTNHKKITIKH